MQTSCGLFEDVRLFFLFRIAVLYVITLVYHERSFYVEAVNLIPIRKLRRALMPVTNPEKKSSLPPKSLPDVKNSAFRLPQRTAISGCNYKNVFRQPAQCVEYVEKYVFKLCLKSTRN